jgi:intracellular sulfur oxidation DsrE/DsrF family protein
MFHLNEEGRAEDTLRNIDNLLKDVEGDVEVLLLVHSKGVYPFGKNKNANKSKVEKLMAKGVKIRVCHNTLESLNLEVDDFIDGIEVVSSVVGELVRRQKDGWLYIKP